MEVENVQDEPGHFAVPENKEVFKNIKQINPTLMRVCPRDTGAN